MDHFRGAGGGSDRGAGEDERRSGGAGGPAGGGADKDREPVSSDRRRSQRRGRIAIEAQRGLVAPAERAAAGRRVASHGQRGSGHGAAAPVPRGQLQHEPVRHPLRGLRPRPHGPGAPGPVADGRGPAAAPGYADRLCQHPAGSGAGHRDRRLCGGK